MLRMIFFQLIGSHLVPLCRQSFSMPMANQLRLPLKIKTKPFNQSSIDYLSMLPFGFGNPLQHFFQLDVKNVNYLFKRRIIVKCIRSLFDKLVITDMNNIKISLLIWSRQTKWFCYSTLSYKNLSNHQIQLYIFL